LARFAVAILVAFPSAGLTALGDGVGVVSSVHADTGKTARPPDPAAEKALRLAEEGEKLYLARDYAQALVLYQRAHETKPSPVSLVMMAQCEYYLGLLHDARKHYEAYLADSPRGEMVEVAKDRIESINRRSATLVINSVPDEAEVRIERETGGAPVGAAHSGAGAEAAGAGAATGAGSTGAGAATVGGVTGAAPATAPSAATGAAAVATEAPKTGSFGPPDLVTGQSPNSFSVGRGRWRVTVAKTNYGPQTRVVDVDVADTKSLFFKLDPIPAHLEVETQPPGATLFVNGNRTRNPYRQDLLPGHVEIFAEAGDHEGRTVDLDLGPGDRRLFLGPDRIRLRYVQRSGRPDLILSSTLLGGFMGASAVAAKIGKDINEQGVSTVTFLLGGSVTGGVLGGLLTNALVPPYIPDNRALFVIGAMWIGAFDGAMGGAVIRQATLPAPKAATTGNCTQNDPNTRDCQRLSSVLRSAFVGSLPGLAIGTAAGALFSNHAPTYGRVTLIQSAAVGGALTGMLVAEATQWHPFARDVLNDKGNVEERRVPLDRTLPAVIGLNGGLAAGLLGAYLPDQSRYGPSWRRVLLIDVGAGAGIVAGMVSGCLANKDCYNPTRYNMPVPADGDARAKTAITGLVGGVVGAAAAWLLTSGTDDGEQSNDTPAVQIVPSVGVVTSPGQSANGTVPGAMLFGVF
jgi:hypothetical protein